MVVLNAISPLDGRYREHIKILEDIFSEKSLMKYRIIVEGEYLIFLSKHPQVNLRVFSDAELSLIRELYNLSLEDAELIKKIEVEGYENIKPTNHDLKAVEYFMKLKLTNTSLEDSLEWIHFALTSEDVNNLAYALMLSDGLEEVILPVLENLFMNLEKFSRLYREIPMLARTHGQPASPTTFGKEFKIFASRLKRQLNQISTFKILAKFNGASGNYNAHVVSYPEINWFKFTGDFIEHFNRDKKIKLSPNFVTAQIEPHDAYAELSHNFVRINNILIDLDMDIWRYISDGWLVQNVVEGEVGSSTMPHKVNPIDFENSEGNLGLANALFTFFAEKFPKSRLQRDLSDSTVERNFGSAFGYSLVGYKYLLKGLSKISVDEKKVLEDLNNHPEVISEAIQTILRREKISLPYEKLKEITRGKKITLDDLRIFVEQLNVSDSVKEELRKITPINYVGLAKVIIELF